MATLDQLEKALRNADAAGDEEAARVIVSAIKEARAAQPRGRDGFLGKVDSVVRGAADTLTLGMSDEIAAGLGAATGIGGEFGDYSGNLDRQRGVDTADAEERGGYRLGGQVAGGVGSGVGLAKNGLSLAANAAQRGAGLGRVAGASAADGAILGAAHGAGSGEGVEGRAMGATVGGFAGGAMGGAAPLAVSVGSAALGAVGAPVMARLRPAPYADKAIGEAVKRSGQSVDDLVGSIEAARADGQDMFNVADALGNAGQRSLAAIARTPNDARQSVVETLSARQMGQGERLSNALAEGFDAPDTAAQRAAALTSARTEEANALYAAARRDAGPVNVTPVLAAIDETLSPGVSRLASPRDRIAPDTIEGALARVRAMLSDGRSNLTDFNALFRVKLDLDDMIARSDAQGAGNRAHALANIQRRVDGALAEASEGYAKARDAFSAASRRIDAVGEGSAATSGRTRAADNVERFGQMTPEEQAAFRAGYADPMIAKVENGSIAPTTNKARALMTGKTDQEFPAFAAPGRGEQMGNRIAREQRMFQTANAALGGSKTADNLADAADLNRFDPAIISNLLRGNIPSALTAAVARAANEFGGMPPAVTSELAKALMETRPELVREILTRGTGNRESQSALRAALAAAITSSGSAGAGRLAAP